MSNCDYYGENVPEQLAAKNESLRTDSRCDSDRLSVQEPWAGVIVENKADVLDAQPRWNESDQADTFNPGAEGERGLGATVVGGSGGALVGHHVGKKSDHGALGAVGGAVAGAVIANMASNAVKGHHHGHGGSARDRRRDRLERRLDRLT